jgi:signal transduction histidine kinase
MFFERLSATIRSLRFRLMLWNVAAGLVTGLGILLALREGVRHTLIHDLDEVLREDLNEIELHFTGRGDYDWPALQEELDRKARGHDFHGWFVRFYDRAELPVWSSVNAPELPAPDSAQKAAGSFHVDHYRLAYHKLAREIDEASAVCVGCNERFITNDMERIDRLVALVAGAIILVVPLGGYLLAGRTTRILANLIHRTENLRPSELKERLPIRGTGDELDALARTVNGLLDRLGDYLREKHDFLADAAHELRTPLAAIRSSVEVALHTDRSGAEYRELLHGVIEQCLALQKLVNQLLLLSETDADRLQVGVAPVPLDDLVARSAEMFQGVAEFQGIELVVGPLPRVSVPGNSHHLRQVLNNLLDNALKFTASRYPPAVESPSVRGRVEITLTRDESRHEARLVLRDNGPGIAEADLPRVFDRFYRADRARSREGGPLGTGLGLSICRAIVSAHHGTIQVESRPGEGATFTVALPLAG